MGKTISPEQVTLVAAICTGIGRWAQHDLGMHPDYCQALHGQVAEALLQVGLLPKTAEDNDAPG